LQRLVDAQREGQSGSLPKRAHARGGEGRIKRARFPARKTLEEFDFSFQRSVKRTVVVHPGQLDFLHARENVVLLRPPGTASPEAGDGSRPSSSR